MAKQITASQVTPNKNRVICNRRASLVTVNWDDRARDGILNGTDFRITEEGRTDTNKVPGQFSIHSPLYGTDYNHEHAYEDQWSCECGNYIGKNFAGKLCPICKTKVEFISIDMTKTGWIILDRDYVIQPIFYKKLRSFIGKPFPEIIRFKDLDKREPTPQNPFDGIGMVEFRERFSEIMDFYLRKTSSTPKKREMYHFIMSYAEYVFTQSIPVYSMHLRPFVVRGESVHYTDDDKLFRRIFTNHKLLNDRYELESKIESARKRGGRRRNSVQYLRREHILYAIQVDLDKLWDLSFETIKKKKGIIRDKIIGGRWTIKFGRPFEINLPNCGNVLSLAS